MERGELDPPGADAMIIRIKTRRGRRRPGTAHHASRSAGRGLVALPELGELVENCFIYFSNRTDTEEGWRWGVPLERGGLDPPMHGDGRCTRAWGI